MTNLIEQKLELIELMKLHYGFATLRPGQEQAIDQVLSGRSCLIVMPTGGGKSLCYQLPALILPGITIVVSPLIALMKDQVDAMQKIGIPAAFINSSLSPEETTQRLQAAVDGQLKLLYIAPERFYNQEFLNALPQLNVSLFAVDEAHCISQWGHDFRPSYRQLKKAIARIGSPVVIGLTATATPEVRRDIVDQLDMDASATIVTGFGRPNLQFGAGIVHDGQKASIITETIMHLPKPIGIVYSGTRARTETIMSELAANGIDAAVYHAGLEANDRQRVQDDFMSGKVPIIVATNAFGMGIDKSNIRFVIHDGLPPNIEAYYQEAGRAGRDGEMALCLLLYSPRDRYLREFFIKGDNPPPSLILDTYDYLLSFEEDRVFITYSSVSKAIGGDAPDMAVSTAIKHLEGVGYVQRSRESNSLAWLKLTNEFSAAYDSIGKGAKKSIDLIVKLERLYADKLLAGWETNLDELADSLGVKRSALLRLIKKLEDQGQLEYRPPFKGTEIIIKRRVERSLVELDYPALEEKARAAYAKLDQMEEYAYHPGCRQQYILNYFGQQSEPCGKCDQCIKMRAGLALDETVRQIEAEDNATIKHPQSKLSTKLTQLETLDLYLKGFKPDQIAKERQLAESTVYEHLAYLIEKKMPIDLDKLVDSRKQKIILEKIKELGDEKVKPLKEALPENITYNDIKLVMAKSRKDKKSK
ncbi:MAG: RecQ family ATP-dependent DNA helicase [Candidatus Falkowbacteria bacterium]